MTMLSDLVVGKDQSSPSMMQKYLHVIQLILILIEPQFKKVEPLFILILIQIAVFK